RSSAADVSLIGAALLLLGWESRWAFRLAQLVALWPATVALVSLLARVYGGSSPHASPRAPAFAAVVLALAVGVFCARPGHGLIGIVLTPRAGGALARPLLPPPVILPLPPRLPFLLGYRSRPPLST